MPLNLSFTHLVVVAIVALVVLGPERLPEAARTAGRLYREWRRVAVDLQDEVREVFSDFTEPITQVISDIRTGGQDDDPALAQSTGQVGDIPPLAPAIPALGPSTGLVAAGPLLEIHIPALGPTPQEGTFVPGPELGATPSP